MNSTDEAVAMPTRIRLLRAIVSMGVHLLATVTFDGTENMPRTGGVLYIMNHLYWLDPVLGLMLVDRKSTVFAADKWFQKPIIGSLLRWTGQAIEVTRGEVDRQALKQALAVLNAGEVLGMAPEGTRSKTGALQKAHTGAAYLASRTGVAILPVAAWGQEKAIATLKKLRRPRIHVVVGPPFILPGTPNRAKGPQLEEYTELMMQRIAELLPPEYRGYYADQVV